MLKLTLDSRGLMVGFLRILEFDEGLGKHGLIHREAFGLIDGQLAP
jgi:hypothetical protein